MQPAERSWIAVPMLALGAAWGRAPAIASVDMPEAMRPHDHIKMSPRRRALGDHAPFMRIEDAVHDFVTHHLSPPDPYL